MINVNLSDSTGVYTVYQLTTCDGREYVGVTGQTIEERTGMGHDYAPVSNVRILDQVTDPSVAVRLEAEWIRVVKGQLGDKCANVDIPIEEWSPERLAAYAKAIREQRRENIAAANRSPERRAEEAERMRANNPMWNPATVEKVKAWWTPERRAAASERAKRLQME